MNDGLYWALVITAVVVMSFAMSPIMVETHDLTGWCVEHGPRLVCRIARWEGLI